jgi:glycosyltransferase involved in cell wall biosynthesis
MRVAIFTETFLPKIDGIVTRLRHTVEHLQRNGDEVLLFCPEGGIKEYKGAKIQGVSALPLPLYPELKLAVPRPTLRRHLEKFQPDLIHVINPAVLGLGGIYYAKALNIPLVASYHTHLPQYLQHYGIGALEGLLWELLKLAHNQAQLNLCTSTAMVKELSTHGIENVDLWQKGVDTEMFQPHLKNRALRERLSQGDPDNPLLIYVGRVSAEKQIEDIKPILEAIPNANLAIVGNGPHRASLEEYFAGTRTYFAGYLEGLELASAYACADAFVFPSQSETLGLVLLEAMAAGCPVVAVDSGGIPDIVTDGVNGYLFSPNNSLSAIAACQKILNLSESQREQLKIQAREEAQRWSWAAATIQLKSYYQSVINTDYMSSVA